MSSDQVLSLIDYPIYMGNNRIETIKEQVGARGYAVGFEGLVDYINDQLPRNEQIGPALRKEVSMYPEIAVRELVANAITHQDFASTGDSPMVEVFSDRIEITNPGTPLIDTLRFIDEPPQSRNEALGGNWGRTMPSSRHHNTKRQISCQIRP